MSVYRVPNQLNKIDLQATDGLNGIVDSLAYRIHETERHLHGWERWYGVAVTPSGETHIADRIGTAVAALQVDAGNDTWGTWTQILGSADTPADSGNVSFDLHRLFVEAVERANTEYYIQIACGASGAAGLSAGDYTEFVYEAVTAAGVEMPMEMMMRRCVVTTKMWMRLFVPGQNTGTMDFYFGLHEYEG